MGLMPWIWGDGFCDGLRLFGDGWVRRLIGGGDGR